MPFKPQPAKDNARQGRSSARSGAHSSNGPGVPSLEPAKRNCDWIPSLAEPYLRGYTPQKESDKSLSGYRFLAQPSAPAPSGRKGRRSGSEFPSAGFFIGYLLNARDLSFLKPTPPEFLVFCFIEPAGGGLHRRLVSEPESLMRKTVEYIRWLTHHPPRFELFADERAALVRHVPTQEWPAARIEHYARNFTIETLAWLVRSALVRRLPDELAASSQTRSASRTARK
jgi:hypothetical protein